MIASPEQLAAIYADFGDPSDDWSDSLPLESLLYAAHEQGVLGDVWIYQLLDDERDLFLVSVEVSPTVFIHSAPTHWREVRPGPRVVAASALTHILTRLGHLGRETQATFLKEVARVVSAAAVLPEKPDGET